MKVLPGVDLLDDLADARADVIRAARERYTSEYASGDRCDGCDRHPVHCTCTRG
jgi:hypothetical protein